MKDDGSITEPQMTEAEAAKLNFVPNNRVRRNTGFHLVDEVGREARAVAGINSLTAQSYQVRSTIRPSSSAPPRPRCRTGWRNTSRTPAASSSRAPRPISATRSASSKPSADPQQADRSKPSWLVALEQVRMPLYDVHWTPAVVVEKAATSRAPNRSGSVCATAASCRSRPGARRTRSRINLSDVVYVKVVENPGQKGGPRVELRVRPTVQGVAVVMENKTGRVLAMVGGFSYPLSQLNRVTQSRRQPGSSLKPMTYLAALNHGLQPNTLIEDAPITYPPIGGVNRYTRADRLVVAAQLRRRLCRHDDDAPRARAIEEPRHRAPARRRHRRARRRKASTRSASSRSKSQVYPQCVRFYPFVLGAQPVRPIDLAGVLRRDRQRRPPPHART